MDKIRVIASMTDPSNGNGAKVIGFYDEVQFPEQKRKSLQYMAKGMKMLKKLKDVKLFARQV